MRAIAIVILAAACGHAAKPAPPVLSNKPAPADAGAAAASEDEVDAAPEEGAGEGEGEEAAYEPTCDSGDSQILIVAGKDASVHIETCTTGEHNASSDSDSGFVYKDRVATLALDRGDGEPISHELATWQDGWEDGQSYSLVGVLKSRGRGDGVVLIESSSYGPADGLDGVSSGLTVMAFADGDWKEVHSMNASVIEVSMSKDGRVATIDTCDPPAKGKGTGCNSTGAASYDGDDHTYELRWEGGRVKQRDVTSKP